MEILKSFENWTVVEKLTAKDGTQRIIYKLENYHIAVTDADYMPGGIEISVSPINRNRYFPNVYVDNRFGTEFQTVRIQTTSWRALEVSEIDEVLKAYTQAKEVAREIERAFPQCFKVV